MLIHLRSKNSKKYTNTQLLIALMSICFTSNLLAGGFFEVGEATLNTTVENGGWVTITTTKPFVNPVVIAGPLSHNNDLSLFPRVRNLGGVLQVGMQSPCETLGAAGGVTCPPAGGWLAESLTYMVIEEGVWEFPDETEVEADLYNTSTIRDNFPGGTGSPTSLDLITFMRTTFDSVPAVMHTVNSFSDSSFISSTAVGAGANNSAVTTTQFKLALEGLEAIGAHGAEDIAWLAIEPNTGSNAGTNYNSGRTAGLDIDRHSDACTSLGHGQSLYLAHHNTMNGNNGGLVRRCAAPDSVHIDEDQVGDSERTGIPERVAWFAYAAETFGNLVFLTADQTVADDNGGSTLPGETLTYTVTITNELNDFTQADNATDEMTLNLPPNTTLVAGSLSASSGILSGSGPLAWNGTVTPGQVITLTYQVTIDNVAAACNVDLDNQATLHMDPNGDGINSIDELSDDPSRDDGLDTDMDNGSDNMGFADDDPTRISTNCQADLSISKDDAETTYTPGTDFVYTLIVDNNGPNVADGTIVSDTLPSWAENVTWDCTATGGAVCPNISGSGNVLSETIVTFPNGGQLVYEVSGTYSADMSQY